jgi:hypothetical protein
MDSLDEARSHADAVDGDDRVQLRELFQSMMKRHADIAAIIASGPTAVMQLSFAELIATLEETAIAGMATLQILGGRLARNEVWGGPFTEDNAEAE